MNINELKSNVKSAQSGSLTILVRKIARQTRCPSGAEDRAAFLAYTYLRGRAYRVAEPTSRDLFTKYGSMGENLLPTIAALVNHYKEDEVAAGFPVVSTENIEKWMSVPETEKRAAKRAAALKKDQERRDAHRAKFAPATLAVAV